MHQVEGQAETNGLQGQHAGARCLHTLEQHLCHVVQATEMASDCHTLRPSSDPERETLPGPQT